jgi:hypothetical protein
MGLLSFFTDLVKGDWDSSDVRATDSGTVSSFTKNIGDTKIEIIDRPSDSTGNAFDIKIDGQVIERHADND